MSFLVKKLFGKSTKNARGRSGGKNGNNVDDGDCIAHLDIFYGTSVLGIILSTVSIQEVISLSYVCKQWNAFAKEFIPISFTIRVDTIQAQNITNITKFYSLVGNNNNETREYTVQARELAIKLYQDVFYKDILAQSYIKDENTCYTLIKAACEYDIISLWDVTMNHMIIYERDLRQDVSILCKTRHDITGGYGGAYETPLLNTLQVLTLCKYDDYNERFLYSVDILYTMLSKGWMIQNESDMWLHVRDKYNIIILELAIPSRWRREGTYGCPIGTTIRDAITKAQLKVIWQNFFKDVSVEKQYSKSAWLSLRDMIEFILI